MSNSSASAQNLEQIESIISIRTQMLMAVFGKRENSDLVAVFKRHLNKYPTWILGKAFTRAETELERFPTVRWLVGACEQLKPSTIWKYDYKDAKDENGVPCKIDPENGEQLYLPQHCAEGRAFLRVFARLAGREVLSEVDLKASAANLQAQKMFISRTGQVIPERHDPRCLCPECVSRRNAES